MVPTYDISILKGDSFSLPITWKDAQDVAIDLTGATVVAQVRANSTSDTVLLEFSTGQGTLTLDGPNGLITLSLTASETANLSFSKGVYDLEVQRADGSVQTILRGHLKVNQGVTR